MSLPQLFKYRKGEYDPNISHLSRILDKDVREMIATMIRLDPEQRYSADQYLKFYKCKVFPEYFYDFLHQYMGLVTDPFSGQRTSNSTNNHGEADERIDRIFNEFDKISYFLNYPTRRVIHHQEQNCPRLGLGPLPVRLNIPNYEHTVSEHVEPPIVDDGTLIFLNVIVSSLRNTARATSRVRACDLLLAFCEKLTDEAKLDRVLPYLVSLLNDRVDVVKIAAIRSISQLLCLVKVITPINANVFSEYLFTRFNTVIIGTPSKKPSPLVRAAYASCLGSLATSANRFLAMASALHADGSLMVSDPEVEPGLDTRTQFEGSFDASRQDLVERFEMHTKNLVEDPDPFVRRAFLGSVPELCIFFGLSDANDIILTHLNTYLNDKDWMLKCAFFDTIVGIGVFVGTVGLEEFILPLIVQALTNTEEHVVQAALHCLAQLAGLGIISRERLLVLIEIIVKFTMHPNLWIREAAAKFVASSAKYTSPAIQVSMLLPRIKMYLKNMYLPEFSELSLLDALKPPLSRTVYDQAVLWAQKAEKGLFWKPLHNLRKLSFGVTTAENETWLETDHSLNKIRKTDEDEKWLDRLRKLGMTEEDEFKLLTLREYIWRLSETKLREDQQLPEKPERSVVAGQKLNLLNLGAKITTVMFDDQIVEDTLHITRDNLNTGGKTLTLEDALQEATATNEVVEGARSRPFRPDNLATVDRRSSLAPPISPVESSVADGQPEGSHDVVSRVPLLRGPSEDGPYLQAQGRIRHQSSALSLINRKESIKSGPETVTTEASAVGEVRAPHFRSSPKPSTSQAPQHLQAKKTQKIHSYEGSDPTIIRMLNSMYVDNFPYDILEFGPTVKPIHRLKIKTGMMTQNPWKPNGTIVASFAEHKGAVNRIVISPDHMFFLTAGDDGTVKVWDTARLEKNPAYRSRQTHRHPVGSKVVALCFIENTHTFVSCANDGTVHVVKVECSLDNHGRAARYTRTRLLREYHLQTDEYAVWCEHYKMDSGRSSLILATNLSRIIALDLWGMSTIYEFENPIHHGTPTCFCLDKRKNWLLLGTSHGVLDLWDLRFRVRLKGWGVPGKAPIFRLIIHPNKGKGKWVCCAGGTGQGEVTVWDLEKTIVREIYRVSSTSSFSLAPSSSVAGTRTSSPLLAGSSRDGISQLESAYKAWDVDDDKHEGMLGLFATAIEPSTTSNNDKGVRGMAVGSFLDDTRDVRNAYIITGGSDRRLRYWDLAQVEKSLVFSGLSPGEGKMGYTQYQLTSTMNLNNERAPKIDSVDGVGRCRQSKRSTGSNRPNRSSVISVQQQNLLKNHLDTIMDVAVLESPYRMVLSADRSGVVFAFS